MNKIAFVFSHAPHGTSLGREGLDAVFSISTIFKKISLFFIGDGVLQLIKNYQTEYILARNYTSAFSVLSLYNIQDFYCCESSLIQRGLHYNTNFILKIDILKACVLSLKLDSHDAIINF